MRALPILVVSELEGDISTVQASPIAPVMMSARKFVAMQALSPMLICELEEAESGTETTFPTSCSELATMPTIAHVQQKEASWNL